MAERARDSNCLCAPHAPSHFVVVGCAGPLGLVVNFDGAPVFQLGNCAPSDLPGPGEQRLEDRSLSTVQIGHGAAQRHEMSHGVPSDEWRLSLMARRRSGECFQVSGSGRAGIAVRVVEHAPREAGPHSVRSSILSRLRQRIESLAARGGSLGTPSGHKHFPEHPATHGVGVVRVGRRSAKVRQENGPRVPVPGGGAARRCRRG